RYFLLLSGAFEVLDRADAEGAVTDAAPDAEPVLIIDHSHRLAVFAGRHFDALRQTIGGAAEKPRSMIGEPARRCREGARRLADRLQQLGRDLVDETAARVRLEIAVDTPAQCVGQVELLHRAGHADVT